MSQRYGQQAALLHDATQLPPLGRVVLTLRRRRPRTLIASAAQVRRPLYGTSSGRWRHCRAHLGPFIQALRKYGVALPDDA